MAETDEKFIEELVKAIVDNPSDVKTERTIDERGVLIKLYVNPEDMGKIIGKEGKTAKAIRTLLRVYGAKNDARLNLKIVEPEGSERPEYHRDEPQATEEAAEVADKHDDDDSASSDDQQKDKMLDDVPNDVLA
ncbi:MAG: KH domain-containing protein [bacterium]|nr:KH domain-containing protein [bacterium]